MKDFSQLKVFQRIAAGEQVRVMALGSSNTERFMVGTHWFDYVQIGFTHKFRRWTQDRQSVDNPALFLNAGISNHTTAELLQRFDRDVSPFSPDLLILTAGINDANPSRAVKLQQTKSNLAELRSRVEQLGGEVIFQTYYSADIEALQKTSPGWADNYALYTEAIRLVAGDMLNDNHRRWERLRKSNVRLYRLLMRDPLHINPLGNAVMGLDLMRRLKLELPDENLPWIRDGLFAQYSMDLLEEKENNEPSHPQK
ncbi:MAG: SGNH/GDSL hydrolase family protein [Lentisphaeria bacterium]|jgi:lysophospholipase L1-like esterase|nr:SGNH/GDSL hydrolase family protein [Lentisphaeria bacterium]MDY0175571.1 SGNH/GDSL hydrolase family protein [Lentisphaeria bacterium]NLZ60615.1 SGNH/GDSL hydrolase family protein [Lentisphaerota bacterium]